MDNQPRRIGAILLPLGMVACCGIPLLLATGVLGGVGAWLADGGIPIIIGAVIAGIGFVYLWRRLGRSEVKGSQTDDQITKSAKDQPSNE